MNRFFKEDTFLMRGLSRAVDLVVLNVLWILCSLPVVTFGAAATAVYDVMLRLADGNDGNVAKLFFRAFARNFKQGTALWMILLAAGVVAAGDVYAAFFTRLAENSFLGVALMAFAVLFAIVWLMALAWVFVLQGHFDSPVKQTLKNALLVAVLHIPSTILFALSIVACMWVTFAFPVVFPFWMFIGYALAAYLLAKRYLPILKQLEGMGKGS